MAVTLYRCSKCRGVFNSVWDTASGRLCRDCKLQTLGYQPEGGKPAGEQVKIVEDIMGGGSLGAAIGGNIGDAQNVFEQRQKQVVELQQAALSNSLAGLMQSGATAAVSGGSEIRSPLQYADSSIRPGALFQFRDGTIRTVTQVSRLDSERIMIVDNLGEITVRDLALQFATAARVTPSPKPEPESSPHDAILKPSRKLKLAAE